MTNIGIIMITIAYLNEILGAGQDVLVSDRSIVTLISQLGRFLSW